MTQGVPSTSKSRETYPQSPTNLGPRLVEDVDIDISRHFKHFDVSGLALTP